jgi:hypothetical protein
MRPSSSSDFNSERRKLMIQIVLTPQEADILRQTLEVFLDELRDEIWYTDTKSFRAMLKTQENFLKNLLFQLQQEDVLVSPS